MAHIIDRKQEESNPPQLQSAKGGVPGVQRCPAGVHVRTCELWFGTRPFGSMASAGVCWKLLRAGWAAVCGEDAEKTHRRGALAAFTLTHSIQT